MHKTLLATSVAVLGMSLAGPAFAQNFSINEVPVPQDQVERIQAHCDTLLSADASAEASADTATATNDSATRAATDADATTAETASQADAETDVAADAATTASTETGAQAGDGVGASPVGNIDFATLDLATVDAEACRTGGFGGAEAAVTTTTN